MPPPPVRDPLTLVEIVFYPEIVNCWLRFGKSEHWRDVDRRRAIAAFAMGKLFAYVRWQAGDYGTKLWTLTIARAGRPGDRLLSAPGIRPGADILVHLKGATRVKKALDLIDRLELADADPATLSPAWWQVTGNRLKTGIPARRYGPLQRSAYLKCRDIGL